MLDVDQDIHDYNLTACREVLDRHDRIHLRNQLEVGQNVAGNLRRWE